MSAEVTPPDGPPDAGTPEPPRGPRRAGVIALALVGLALTAGITYAASTLVSQPIGLTSEPATAGDSLAPAAPLPMTTSSTAPAPQSTTPTVTTTVTTPQSQLPPQPVTSAGDDGHGKEKHDDDD